MRKLIDRFFRWLYPVTIYFDKVSEVMVIKRGSKKVEIDNHTLMDLFYQSMMKKGINKKDITTQDFAEFILDRKTFQLFRK